MLQFSRRDDLQNTGFDPAIENRKTCLDLYFWSCGKHGERKHFIRLPISHCCTFKVLPPNNRCKCFFNVLNARSEISRIREQDVFPKRFADNITRSYFRHYCTESVSNCCLPNLRKTLRVFFVIAMMKSPVTACKIPVSYNKLFQSILSFARRSQNYY